MKRYIIWAMLLWGAVLAACEDEEKVEVIEVTKLTLNKSEVTLAVSEKVQVVPALTPQNATDTVVVWSSEDAMIASVDGLGVITGLKEGNTKISGKVGQGFAELTVKVVARQAGAGNILLSPKELHLIEGEKDTLLLDVYPGLEGEAVWLSSDEQVAMVNSEGEVLALRAGVAEIRVKVGEKEAVCNLTVYEKFIAATGLKFEVDTVKVKVGETVDVAVRIEPEDATERNIEWKISKIANVTYATVEDGKVTGVKVDYMGYAIVKLKAIINDEIWAEVPVYITQPAVSVTLGVPNMEIGEGGHKKLSATVEPYETTDKTLVWSSSDEAIVSVDQEGNIEALKPGVAVITATCGEVSGTCEVTVLAEEGTVLTIPDEKFLEQLLLECDHNENGRITDVEAKTVAKLDLVSWYNGIESLEGIEYFVNLRELYLGGNSLKELDLSKNKELTDLRVDENPLTTLDIAVNPKLVSLEMRNMPDLESVDLSKNKDLSKLDAENSAKFILSDFHTEAEIISLSVNGTATTDLKLTGSVFAKLKSLYCGTEGEKLTITFPEEGLANLDTFYLYGDLSTEILDLSKMLKLEFIDIASNVTYETLKTIIVPTTYKGDTSGWPTGITVERK